MNRQTNGLPPNAIAFLFSVLSLNWKPVIDTLIHHQHFSDDEAKTDIWKYACFLSLTFLYPHLTLIPPRSIDNVQHVFEALPTYSKSMNKLNHTIEHRPYEDGKEAFSLSQEEQFEQTKNLLRRHYGILISKRKKDSDDMSGCILRNAQYSRQSNIGINRPKIT